MNRSAVLILAGLFATGGTAYPVAAFAQAQSQPQALAQALAQGDGVMPRIDAPLPKVDMANADLPKSDMPGAVADAGMIDADIITGAVMNEKDMLQYCVNVSDEAREARYALIKAKLDETEAEVDQKLVSLEKKLKAVREYVEIRKEFQAAAEAQVVSIFGTMRPDAAAQQIARLDVRLAAAIIMKLDPKVSSIILAEMRPKAAATLAGFISASMMSEEKVGTDQ